MSEAWPFPEDDQGEVPIPAKLPPAADVNGQKRLSEEQWAEIRAHYSTGTMRTPELSKTYDISITAISKHFKKYGVVWASNRVLVDAAVAKKVADAQAEAAAVTVSTFAMKRKERIDQTKEEHYNWQVTTDKMIAAVLGKQIKSGAPVGDVFHDIKTIRAAKQAFEIGRQSRYKILDIENDIDEKELPSLSIENLTNEEIEKLQSSDQDTLDEDLIDDDLPEA